MGAGGKSMHPTHTTKGIVMFKFNNESATGKYSEYLDEKWFSLNQHAIYKLLLGHLLVILTLIIMLQLNFFQNSTISIKSTLVIFATPWAFGIFIQLVFWGMGAITPTKSLMDLQLFEIASRIIMYPYGYILGNKMILESQKKINCKTP